MRARLLLGALLLWLSAPAGAADRQFVHGEAVTLDPGLGYVLVRTFQVREGGLHGTAMFAPLLFRVLGDGELARARAAQAADPDDWRDAVAPNVVEPLADHAYATANGEAYLLTALTPGTYVLGGLAVSNWATISAGIATTSLCMGTVKFEVRPGMVTDLGAILAAPDDAPTDIPELSRVVAGKPIGDGSVPMTMAIRIVPDDVPAGLAALPRMPADYRAVGAMPNYIGAPLSRLAPLPGVLDYDKDGNVIDLKAKPSP